jgi:hypothetical protein
MTISGKPSKTDWERVRRSVEMDEPVPYDANGPDDGPYDPNDDEAVARFLTEANRVDPAQPAKKKAMGIAKKKSSDINMSCSVSDNSRCPLALPCGRLLSANLHD